MKVTGLPQLQLNYLRAKSPQCPWGVLQSQPGSCEEETKLLLLLELEPQYLGRLVRILVDILTELSRLKRLLK
jgi:hypothetical protein